MKKTILSLLCVVLVCLSFIEFIYAYKIVAGGESIGIRLRYDGVLITGMYDIEIDNNRVNQEDYGFKKYDLITHINNERITSIQELSHFLSYYSNSNKDIYLTIFRNNNSIKKKLKIHIEGSYVSTGLYVRDGISGLGTITYYRLDDHSYGALGHLMGDDSYISKKGDIYESSINRINPSSKYEPGEKIGTIDSKIIGSIEDNTVTGIYGYYNELPEGKQNIQLLDKYDLKKGDAYFLTVLSGNKVERCDIEIISINSYKSKIKNFTFKVKDKKLLSISNGIVQGMSGSPIIQNGKLVGAVTHVLVNDPTRGYGIFIENMLEAAR